MRACRPAGISGTLDCMAWPDRSILRRSGRSVRTLLLLEAPHEPTDVRDG